MGWAVTSTTIAPEFFSVRKLLRIQQPAEEEEEEEEKEEEQEKEKEEKEEQEEEVEWMK